MGVIKFIFHRLGRRTVRALVFPVAPWESSKPGRTILENPPPSTNTAIPARAGCMLGQGKEPIDIKSVKCYTIVISARDGLERETTEQE